MFLVSQGSKPAYVVCQDECVPAEWLVVMKITIDEADILYVVSAYLQSAGFHQTAHCLFLETNHTPDQYGRDVTFARELTMSGRWEELSKFLEPLKRSAWDYDRAMFEVDRQHFLEVLDSQTSVPNSFGGSGRPPPTSEELVGLLKKLEGRCSQSEFHSLCFTLTVSSMSAHPDYASWTVYSGRASLFSSLLSHLRPIFPDQVRRRGRAASMAPDHLVTLLQQAVATQLQDFREANPNARLPEDVFASVLGDTFTYQKAAGGQAGGSKAAARQNGYGRFEWALDTVEERRGTKMPPSEKPDADKKRAGGGGGVEDVQGFYGVSGASSDPGIEAGMEVTHFPPVKAKEATLERGVQQQGGEGRHAAVNTTAQMKAAGAPRPPVAWEIKMGKKGDGGNLEEGQEEASHDSKESERRRIEAERQERLVEEERKKREQELMSAVDPNDPYANINMTASIKKYIASAFLLESHPIRTVSFSPSHDGRTFAVGTNSKALRICRISKDDRSIEILHERAGHHLGSVYCSSWNADSTLLATGSNDKTVKVCKVFLDDDSDESRWGAGYGSHVGGDGIISSSFERDDLVLKGHTGTVRDVSFHPSDPTRLLSAGAHNNVALLWDIVGVANQGDGIKPIAMLEGHEDTVFCGRFSPFETHFAATGGSDNTVRVWDLRGPTSKGSAIVTAFESAPLSIVWASNGHGILTSHADGTIRSIDLRKSRGHPAGSPQISSVTNAHKDECRSIDATPCGRYLLSSSFDGTAAVFTMPTQGVLGPEFNAQVRGKGGGKLLQGKWRNKGKPGFIVAGSEGLTYYCEKSG